MDKIKQIEADIKSLKIQGATNVALAVIDGLKEVMKTAIYPADYHEFLFTALQKLAQARPTEPLAVNALKFIFQAKQTDPTKYAEMAEKFKEILKSAKETMGQIGSQLIADGGIYLTHCHSSTVTNMFMEAYLQGKKFSVYATETRPLYQGRITARELIGAGLTDVTMIIDDAAASILLTKPVSAVFIGADLLSSSGFVNKVGSLGITFAANSKNIPVYVLSILLKYDHRPFKETIIERREGVEIWENAPKGLTFHTPAFDFIPYFEQVRVINEMGILKGPEIMSQVLKKYPFIIS